MHRDHTTSSSPLPASARLSVKIISFCILFVSPFIFLWLTDRAFSFVHWHLCPECFPSEREVMIRNNLMPREYFEDEKAFMEQIKSSKVKVAIFGSSSAAGYAAPIGFARFLAEAAPDRLVVHNYAEGGAPFVGYQAELAKIAMPYYDVIVVYAGHNEIWSYLYRRSRELNEAITLPWGSKVEYQAADFRHSLKMMELKRLFNDNLFGDDSSYASRIRTAFGGMIYNISSSSRLSYFIKSLGSKVIAGVVSEPPEKRHPFFLKSPFIGDAVKQRMVDDYKYAILEIKNKLHSNQRLLISTVLSNDLFPPQLDAVDKEAELAVAESKAASLYDAIATPGSNLAPDEISTLAGSAHKEYLNAVHCLGGLYPVNSENHIEKKCLDIARNARQLDAFPGRTHPGINDFIRSLANTAGNIYIIDPERHLRGLQNQSDYFDSFVDFQHPSSLGHMNIANDMLQALLPGEEIKLSWKSRCDEFLVQDSAGERPITARKDWMVWQLRVNIRWLELFSKRASAPFLYEFYKRKALEKMRNCVAAGSP